MFNKDEHLPKQANWATLFDWMVGEATEGDGKALRTRTYWYVVRHMDFRPWFPLNDQVKMKELFIRHNKLKPTIEGLSGNELDDKIKETVQRCLKYKNTMTNRFKRWNDMYDVISANHKSIEFRRAGTIHCDLPSGELFNEKAVDVNLAVDMIMLRNNYDIALLVSGDQDYVPAVQAAKNFGKKVINVAFMKKNNELLPNGARRLRHKTDWSLEFDYETFKTWLFADGSQRKRISP